MSSHYNTEPPATATATLHTTLGPIHLSLFGAQTPLTTRNFLQHVADNYYTGTIFHRVVPGFVVQGGDPTGTGAGGTSIYEEPEFETDPEARDPTEKIVLRDELHSRLRFNRRGLVGMAKSEDGTYGSQFFITLANTERELNGQCTLFGRVEGDSIFTVLKIAEAELVEGTERPVYPVKVTGCEVGELGKFEGKVVLNRRVVAAAAAQGAGEGKKGATTKKKSKKPKKTLLSFAGGDGEDENGEEGDEEIPVRPAKPKYNAALVTDAAPTKKHEREEPSPPPRSKRPSTTTTTAPQRAETTVHKTPDPSTQLPLRDPESPLRTPSSPEPVAQPAKSRLDRTNAEIESVMASMRRTTAAPMETSSKKSALEAMIPSTAIRGRRRPAATTTTTTTTGSNGINGFTSSADAQALKMFNAFKAKLENADSAPTTNATIKTAKTTATTTAPPPAEEDDEEAQLCDLHFIANCQSCQSWDEPPSGENADNASNPADAADDDRGWLTHQLQFKKDTLGKDLNWKKAHPDDVDSLMVIDPREKEREIAAGKASSSGKRRGLERDRERERKRGRVGDLEWERERERR
ncbi:putative peptidyl-prolyl cis-trans isomerase, partial [Aspergillus saccharolyticus JOP 1030-1]